MESTTEVDYRAWLADDESFNDDYAGWVSGSGNPIRKIGGSPEADYARRVLRSYLPGFADAEVALDPYRKIGESPKVRSLKTYTTAHRIAAVLMAERLGIRKTSVKLGVPFSTLRRWVKEGIEPKADPAMPGRKRGNRPERVCPCGDTTRYHLNYKPRCQICYVTSEEYQRDRRQWQSDVMVLKTAVSR